MQPINKERALLIIKDAINLAQSTGKLRIEDSVSVMNAFNFIKSLEEVLVKQIEPTVENIAKNLFNKTKVENKTIEDSKVISK